MTMNFTEPPLKELEGYSEDNETRDRFQRKGAMICLPVVALFFVSFIGGFEHWAQPRICFSVAGGCFLFLLGSLVAVNTVIMPTSRLSGNRMRRVVRNVGNGEIVVFYIDDASRTYFSRQVVKVSAGRGVKD